MEWAIEEASGLALVVVTREEPRGVTHRRVLASVPPKAAKAALAKLKKKYGVRGERLPEDAFNIPKPRQPKEEKMSKKRSQKKAPTPKNGQSNKAPEVSAAQLDATVKALSEGKSTLPEQAKALGVKRGPNRLRHYLQLHMGGGDKEKGRAEYAKQITDALRRNGGEQKKSSKKGKRSKAKGKAVKAGKARPPKLRGVKA